MKPPDPFMLRNNLARFCLFLLFLSVVMDENNESKIIHFPQYRFEIPPCPGMRLDFTNATGYRRTILSNNDFNGHKGRFNKTENGIFMNVEEGVLICRGESEKIYEIQLLPEFIDMDQNTNNDKWKPPTPASSINSSHVPGRKNCASEPPTPTSSNNSSDVIIGLLVVILIVVIWPKVFPILKKSFQACKQRHSPSRENEMDCLKSDDEIEMDEPHKPQDDKIIQDDLNESNLHREVFDG